MESHPKSATAENNLYNASYYIIQERKIAQRCARQSKTLEAHVPPPQNHIGESVSACLWPSLSNEQKKRNLNKTKKMWVKVFRSTLETLISSFLRSPYKHAENPGEESKGVVKK